MRGIIYSALSWLYLKSLTAIQFLQLIVFALFMLSSVLLEHLLKCNTVTVVSHNAMHSTIYNMVNEPGLIKHDFEHAIYLVYT